ncbi:type II toxin-antitoxin system prevent-host-death family antitoxin [Candidatus Saccharibacteria bacterium]|nr:type II toxin-antitoxin system prevent-host-death family antitoxin [Candidatus Saccharibacteria bacterium]
MEITLTELKNNLGKYILLSKEEDILVTKNGKIVSRLTEPFSARKEKMEKQRIAKKLVGSIKTDTYLSLDDIREERLSRK